MIEQLAKALTERLIEAARREANGVERAMLKPVERKLKDNPALMESAITLALEGCNLKLLRKESEQ